MPASNPRVDQGILNKLRGSLVWQAAPELNVVASFLGPEGLRLSFEGEAVTYFPTLTGAVISPEPYQQITLTINLLKTQPLSDAYKRRWENNASLGDATVRPDSTQLSPYQITNCSIKNCRELSFAGTDPIYAVLIGGYYPINQSLFNF